MGDGNDAFGSTAIEWESEPVPTLGRYDGYERAREGFEWTLPETFNVATDVVTRHAADRTGVALAQRIEDGDERTHTFRDFERESNRLANALEARGLERGDRVAIVGSRSDRLLLAHLATWKVGAISVPLSVLYGSDALAVRLGDCEPRVVFADLDRSETLAAALAGVERVEYVVGMDGEPEPIDGVETVALADLEGGLEYDAVETAADDAAFLLYTSGTTGRPKGVLHAHRTLLGWLPGFQLCFELPWHESEPLLYVTPDLAWIGGLNLVLGSWHYGFPAFCHDSASGFDPAAVFENVDRYGLTHAVLVPGMLKAMADLDASQYDLSSLEVVLSGSEPVSARLHDYVTENLDATLNEMYGQTEALHLVTSCSQWLDAAPGSLGYPVPGHDVRVLRDDGTECAVGEVGTIAVGMPDPAVFTELWNDEEATERRFIDDGEWLDTGDLGYADADGQLWFTSRADDLILTNGYRVGPTEIEASIRELESVAEVGVVGLADERRGELIAACVQPSEGVTADQRLAETIAVHVSERLAAHQYPRRVAFVEELPTTVTGKLKRRALEDVADGLDWFYVPRT